MAEWRSQYCTTDNQYILFRIWVKETATNVIANTSTLSISVYAWRTNEGYTTNYGGGCNVKIDGVARGYQYWDWGECPISYDSDTFLYDESGIVIQHNSNGTKTINVAATCEWYANGSIYIDSSWQSFDITLTALDRSAPTVSVSTSNIGVNSFTINASSNVNCDRWDRSIDNGSTWTNFSTTNGTSASTTVTGLSPNTTYNVKVRARKTSNQVYGTSGTTSPKTIGNSILNSVNTVTADNATVQIGLNATVYVTSYTHKLVLKNGSTTILTKTGISLTNGNNTITLTSSERSTILNAMRSIKSFTGTFELTTWSGSTQIGSMTSKTATVQTTAANSAPTFTGFTYSDTNSTTTAITNNNQVLIQGYSTLQAVASTATAKNGATIKTYSLAAGSTTASSTSTTINAGTISNTGTVTVTVSAVDSRGYSTSRSVNVTVLPYNKIKFNTETIRRVNEVENTIQLSFTGTIQNITVVNVDKNSLQICQYRYKKTSDTTYSAYTNITSGVTRSGNNLTYSNTALVALDANYSWNVQVYIQDRLTTDTITLTVGQGTPLMSWRTKKVGINNKNPSEALDVGGNISTTGNIYYQGTKSKDAMIEFLNNNSDTSGNGIAIGGGGLTVVGGGESAHTMAQGQHGGIEKLWLCSDEEIRFFTNCQNGSSSAKSATMDTSGCFSMPNLRIVNRFYISEVKKSYSGTSITFSVGNWSNDGYLLLIGEANGSPVLSVLSVHNSSLRTSAIKNLGYSISVGASSNGFTVTIPAWSNLQAIANFLVS